MIPEGFQLDFVGSSATTRMFFARQLTVIIAALVFVGAIVAAHLFTPEQAPRLVEKITNSLHAPGFAAVAIIILKFLKPSNAGPVDYIKAGLIACAIGVSSEVAQIPGPRDADVFDIIDDVIGITAGLGTIALFDSQLMSRTRKAGRSSLLLITAIATILTFGPMIWYSNAYIRQHRAVPTLLSFDYLWETSIIEWRFFRRSNLGTPPPGWPVSSDKIAYAKTSKYRTSIITIFPYADWSDFSTLSFVGSIDSDAHTSASFYVRDNPLDGRDHSNRYVKILDFGPKPRRYEISLAEIREAPVDKALDVANIWSIGLSTTNDNANITFLLDDFRLE